MAKITKCSKCGELHFEGEKKCKLCGGKLVEAKK